MPDEFGPRVEADAFRVYLYMSAFPDHGVMRTILQVDDDASVSFAIYWLHEAQPKPLIGGELFDAWRVEKFTDRHEYVAIAQGLAERPCKVRVGQRNTFREWQEERSGASELRNGIGGLHTETSGTDSSGGRLMARPRKKRRGKPRVALTPFQAKMQALREAARLKNSEKPRAELTELQKKWQELVSRNRS